MDEEILEKFKEIFREDDPTRRKTRFYEFGGRMQSKRKREFIEASKRIAEERGIPGYQGDREDLGVPLGARYLEPYYISGTDTICDMDDIHQINNAAIQQLGDDIKRTAINGLDLPHRILQQKVGVTVTPETINRYLESINHSLVGGALAQEHMAEINPLMTRDGYAKVITGDDELADALDKRFLIDINREFPEEMAEKLKDKIGNHLYQVSRIPTIGVRIADGSIVHRWNGNQSALAFVSAYKLGGGSILAEFTITVKHMAYMLLGTQTWPRRGPRGANEPIGIPYGYIGDFCQADTVSDDPVHYCMEAMAISGVVYGLIWFDSYVLGGIGGANTFSSPFTNNLLDDFAYHISDWVKDRYGGLASARPSFEVVKEVTEEVNFYGMEQYDTYPLLLEHHWGGVIRLLNLNAASAIGVGFATGNSTAALLAVYYSGAFIQKEAWGRHNVGIGDAPDQINIANLISVRPDEGVIPELRSPNIPEDSVSASIFVPSPAACFSAHRARGDAWCLSPVVKVAFADPSLVFDFRHVREEIARGTKGEFMPAGDRDPIKPGR
ncbi:MAG TPA: coenzyme-B sulfoethylthiotransferase subunit alpha [Candidatus Syntrophoarchaeum butanivorans]|uniref:coenzyme-B sulfoethylthiotransferase n=1 Tax=Candidatus Syntropharchaeum butanivorans TaxID=1839936 RepID=A0A1F2P3I8_9EURY|nr:MAG: methyl coenzyme M reductase alpha subunit [Candidatus Syntrophoarchaeum butanivorans]HEC56768.1 coenzyme-B sulfoethylthiotransferase subunit alpha [Candidatus Syntrophoarchaeum butanivorans]